MALGRPKAADRPDGVAGTVMEDGKDETVLFIPVGHCRQTAQGERWRAQWRTWRRIQPGAFRRFPEMARLRTLGEDQASAIVEGRAFRPDDLPGIAFGIEERETATAEREVCWLAEHSNAFEAPHRRVHGVDARRILEIDRKHGSLEDIRAHGGPELLLVILGGEKSEHGAAGLKGDEALVAVLRLRPAELPVEARHLRHLAHRESHKADSSRYAIAGCALVRTGHGLGLGPRVAEEFADVCALCRRLRIAHALAPVYERRPRRQNRDARMNAAMVPRMRNPRPSGSSRPAITCAGTVTATPIGTALDSVTRSQPGYTSTGNLPASMNDQ